MNSMMFPFSIHSDTITNWFSYIVTPSKANTFGWLMAFHLIASLQNLCVGCDQLINAHSQGGVQATYPSDFAEITCQVHPQDLGCDSLALKITYPHVRKPAFVLRDTQSVVTKWYLERFWKQGPATAHIAQSSQMFPPDLGRKIGKIQNLQERKRTKAGENQGDRTVAKRGKTPLARYRRMSERCFRVSNRLTGSCPCL